jgi:hypothetical protein
MMPLRRFSTLLFIFALLGASWSPARAQSPEYKYFSETGHNVSGEFLKFYNANPNAIFLYGYPITEEFTSKDGKNAQYFQRARFEYNVGLPEGQRIQVTPLGRLTYVTTGALDVNNTFACRAYEETGFAVCFSFLEFFDQYGGVGQFGYPISGFEYHENKLVQYFEKTRLEWQPWKPEGQRVVVADLGRAYFDQLGEDLGLIPPVLPLDATTQKMVLSVRVRAFVWKAVTLANDAQAIFVIVQDQNLQPVANANCTSIVHWPDGHNDSYALTTNPNGVGVISLAFGAQPYGSLVYADVSCAYHGLNGNTTTSFRIWY